MDAYELNRECTEIIRSLMANYSELQPDSKLFGQIDHNTGYYIAMHLLTAIANSTEIREAHRMNDFGK